ncbi:MAG: DUF393 domain-containing protein [Pyrinomonadaceae bacterium]|nr:DUF393 domain-containing protein [Pyrinomonadaceae bacterium]
MSQTTSLEVYTDGRCPLCQWMRARVEPRDLNRRIEWIDYHDPAAQRRAAPYTLPELAAEMHVRRKSGGAWAKGFGAWLEVLRVLPRWSWLAGVLSVWPLTSIGPVIYRQVAGRRYQLFGIPPPCDESGACALHTSQK